MGRHGKIREKLGKLTNERSTEWKGGNGKTERERKV